MKRLGATILAVLAIACAAATFRSSDNQLIIVGTVIATNIVANIKSAFVTNYVCETNYQFFVMRGTNQWITLPDARKVIGQEFRFSMDNAFGSFILTNFTGSQTIRDSRSLGYTNVGVGEISLISDGANWWSAGKGKVVLPCASWSQTNDIQLVKDVSTNIPFSTLEFNNSQGIGLRTKAGFLLPTEIIIKHAGLYMFQFSIMIKGTATANASVSVWLRKNGATVPRTRTDQTLSGANDQIVMTVIYFVDVPAGGCYFELAALSHAPNPPTLNTNPEDGDMPLAPAIIVTINRVSDPWP